jgi:dihydrofolate synthase/folylpolyglutamate synthase
MDYDATKAYLFGLKQPGSKYGIDRMTLLAARLGHPERAYPVIHVAGTNGKGSVCAMLEAVYRRAGLRVGMYTSPHLVFLGERVQVDRHPLTPAEITRYVAELQPHADALAARDPDDSPSFFEFMTAMAFLHFARQKVDLALIEVGLGGRLDATNVVAPALTIITSIGLDHLEFLGDTLPQIAREKAGILKPGVPVVLGRLPSEAESAIRAVAADVGAKVFSVREHFGDDLEKYPRPRLEGSHQRVNAATASLAVSVLEGLAPQFKVSPADITAALAEVDWPARWQRFPFSDNRQLILDASHNAEGARTLDENLARLRAETGRAPIVLVGALGEYRAEPLLAVIARHAREIILLEPAQSRATPFATLEKFIPASFAGSIQHGHVAELFPAPGICTLGAPGDPVVVTGSIYLLGEILERFAHATPAGEGILQDSP